MPEPSDRLVLHTLAGPERLSFTVEPPGPAIIGRSADAPICLPDVGVSRHHAALARREGIWHVSDLGSTAGTSLNGIRLPRGIAAAVAPGDVLRIGPWVLRVGAADLRRTVATIDDSSSSAGRVRRARDSRPPGAGDRRLALLVRCIAQLHAAPDDAGAAVALLDSVLAGSGFPRGAVLRRAASGPGDQNAAEVVASRGFDPAAGNAAFSRSLLDGASAGETVVLADDSPVDPVASIGEMGIHSAMCVPILLGPSVVGYLYLDARGRESAVQPDASGFCESAAAAYALALSNLQRSALERDQALLRQELGAAREVQELFLPPPVGRVGPAAFAVNVEPGAFVAGDLFDVLPLECGAAAFCLGDVSGHGAASAILMAVTQTFLTAELLRGGSPEAAVERANRYLCSRVLAGRFVSLCVGVLSPGGACRMVDAGHGHALLVRRDGAMEPLPSRCIPAGIDPDALFAATEITLAPGDRIVLYSDGMIEQRDAAGREFGAERLRAALATTADAASDVRVVMERLKAFAGAVPSDDDATIASVEFTGP